VVVLLPGSDAVDFTITVRLVPELAARARTRFALGSASVPAAGVRVEVVERLDLVALLASLHATIVRTECDNYDGAEPPICT
jgi:hypothetical protein